MSEHRGGPDPRNLEQYGQQPPQGDYDPYAHTETYDDLDPTAVEFDRDLDPETTQDMGQTAIDGAQDVPPSGFRARRAERVHKKLAERVELYDKLADPKEEARSETKHGKRIIKRVQNAREKARQAQGDQATATKHFGAAPNGVEYKPIATFRARRQAYKQIDKDYETGKPINGKPMTLEQANALKADAKARRVRRELPAQKQARIRAERAEKRLRSKLPGRAGRAITVARAERARRIAGTTSDIPQETPQEEKIVDFDHLDYERFKALADPRLILRAKTSREEQITQELEAARKAFREMTPKQRKANNLPEQFDEDHTRAQITLSHYLGGEPGKYTIDVPPEVEAVLREMTEMPNEELEGWAREELFQKLDERADEFARQYGEDFDPKQVAMLFESEYHGHDQYRDVRWYIKNVMGVDLNKKNGNRNGRNGNGHDDRRGRGSDDDRSQQTQPTPDDDAEQRRAEAKRQRDEEAQRRAEEKAERIEDLKDRVSDLEDPAFVLGINHAVDAYIDQHLPAAQADAIENGNYDLGRVRERVESQALASVIRDEFGLSLSDIKANIDPDVYDTFMAMRFDSDAQLQAMANVPAGARIEEDNELLPDPDLLPDNEELLPDPEPLPEAEELPEPGTLPEEELLPEPDLLPDEELLDDEDDPDFIVPQKKTPAAEPQPEPEPEEELPPLEKRYRPRHRKSAETAPQSPLDRLSPEDRERLARIVRNWTRPGNTPPNQQQ